MKTKTPKKSKDLIEAKPLAPAEARAAFSFTITDHVLEPSEENELLELVQLLSSGPQCARFPTWEDKSRYLKIPLDKIHWFRRLKQYREALNAVTRLVAAERSTPIVDRVALHAEAGGEDMVGAAKLVLETSGAKKVASETNITDNRSVNVTLESQLRQLVASSVDATFEKVQKP